jgi:hypothetical protein
MSSSFIVVFEKATPSQTVDEVARQIEESGYNNTLAI